MSVTLTENRTTYNFARTLADYDLHHSEALEGVSAEPNQRATPEGTGENPPDWVDEYRRVPEYRPIDHTIDFAYRSVYQNGFEQTFLWNMFTGIRLVSVSTMPQLARDDSDRRIQATNRIWRATGGRVNDTYFRWKVGGEI